MFENAKERGASLLGGGRGSATVDYSDPARNYKFDESRFCACFINSGERNGVKCPVGKHSRCKELGEEMPWSRCGV